MGYILLALALGVLLVAAGALGMLYFVKLSQPPVTVSNRRIRQVEKALGYPLRDWQKAYLQMHSFADATGRRTGKTTAQILALALSDGPPLHTKDMYQWAGRDALHDGVRPGRVYSQYWINDFLRVHEKLRRAGLPVRLVIRDHEVAGAINASYSRGSNHGEG